MYNLISPKYAASWRIIGTSLGLDSGLLDIIEHDYHHKAEDCCNAVWRQWLDIDGTATWYKVAEIIDSPAISPKRFGPGIDVVTCDVINHVSNQMQQYYIKERYKISEDDWPPYQPDHFTGVALIHHKNQHRTVREVIEFAKKMHSGSVKVDDTACQCTKDITEIFTPAQNSDTHFTAAPHFILIEGAPGIGKTILSKEIAFQWANKALLIEKQLLFLIFLRDPYVRKINSLREFVAYAICSSLLNKNVELISQYLENTSGIDVTIVFDGYDEISCEIRGNSFIAKIINRKILMHCGLVITSRPTASTNLHGNADRRVEILGFTKVDRMRFVRQSLKGNPIKIKQLETYLEENPFINSLCYIPLNMTILMCIFKEILDSRNHTLPKNQTEINDHFICITISRFLRRKNASPSILKSLTDLPAPYKQHFKNLSKLAFELLGKDQIVFDDNDMKQYQNWSDLGLLKTVKCCNFLKDTPVMSYNFLHFTLQEFLAAHYVTSLSLQKQVNVMKSCFWDARYLNTWIMYVGLTYGDSFALKHFLTGRMYFFQSLLVKPKEIANETAVDKMKCLHLFQCFLEAGNSKMCHRVGNYLVNERIDLSNTTLLPKDMHTLCFFLTRSTTKQWKLLDLSNCYIGDDGCDILANLLPVNDKTNLLINEVNFSCNSLKPKSICNIFKIVQYFKVKELILTGNTFDSKIFAEDLFTNVIQQKLFHDIFLTIKTDEHRSSVYAINCRELLASQVQKYVHSNSKIYSFYLWNTAFKANDVLMLFSNVNTDSSIELNIYKEGLDSQIIDVQAELQETMNRITGEGNVLEIFSLHLIKVSYILVSQTQVLACNVSHSQIIQIIRHNCKPTISVLSLNSCTLSSESFHTIGNVISSNCNKLQFIDLSGCNMEDEDCEHFCKVLFSSSSAVQHLEEFNLSCNKLTSTCISPLFESLKYCAIKKLVISRNNVQENASRDVIKFYCAQCSLLYSSFKVPLLVISDTLNLQSKLITSESCTDVYVVGCKNMTTFSLLDCLPTSGHGMLLQRVIFLNCSLLLTNNFGSITSVLDDNSFLQVEFYETNLTENEATDCVNNLEKMCYHYTNLNLKYILTSGTKLLAKNCAFKELKELGLNLQLVTTLQLIGCNIRAKDIKKIFTDINIYNGLLLIDLSKCDIGDESCITLSDFFKSYRVRNCSPVYVKVLNLSYNSLTSASIMCIVNLLQCCIVEKLILSNNHISNDDFNQIYFRNRYDSYANISLNIPLVLINSENLEGKKNFTIYTVNMLINRNLINVINSLKINNELNGSLFLVNTNLQVDCFIKIISLLHTHEMLKLTVIEYNLENDMAAFVMKNLQILLCGRERSGCNNIQYFLLSNNHLWTNSINETIITEILTSTLFLLKNQSIVNDIFLVDILKYKQWQAIDLSNCKIGDNGFTRLLECFVSLNSASSLNALNISNNNLSLNSAEKIAKLIIYSKLKSLVISNNLLGESHIADALIKMSSASNSTALHSIAVKIINNDCAAVVAYNSSDILIDEMLICPHEITYISMRNCDLCDNDDDDDGSDNIIEVSDDDDDDDNDDIIDIVDDDENDTDDDDNVDGVDTENDDNNINKFDQVNLHSDGNKISENFNLNHIALQDGITTNTDNAENFNAFKLPSLAHFELTKCTIQEKQWVKVFNILGRTYVLQTLIINSINITNNIANEISTVIDNNLHLEKINLSDCYIPEDGIKKILAALNKSLYLKYINLSSPKYKRWLHRNNNDNGHTLRNQTTLFSSIPFIIGANRNLEYLNISNCKIEEDELIKIIENLSSIKSIRHLNISGNNITESVANHLAYAIRSNANLEYLNISKCYINDHELFVIFSALSGLNRLMHMDVSLNRICSKAAQELINVLSKNLYLTHLSLHKCDLDVDNCIKIISSLKKHKFLTQLDFSYNEINDDIALILSSIVLNNIAIKYIDISYCNITEQGIRIVADSLKTLSYLKYFNISHNYMSHSSAKYIASVIACNESIEHLDISDCVFMDFKIIDLWLCKNSALKELILKSNAPFQTYRNSLTLRSTSTEDADIIDESIHSYVEHLDISSCHLSGIQLINTAKYLQTASTLRYLDISYNKVSKSAATEIASVILHNPFLETLIFSCCGLSRSKFTSITKALRTISTLKHLDFSDNTLTSDEENDIGSVIIHNPFLEHLNLSNCKLSEIQISGIVKALNIKSRLKYLDISYNGINQNASIGIASVITNSLSLQYLNLSGCTLKETAFKIIANSLKNVRSLTSIDVSNSCITYKTAQSIAVALSNNLDIEQLNFSHSLMDNSALVILNAIDHHNAITHLSLRSNIITYDLAKLIAAIISLSQSIVHLDLGHCNLQECGFFKILDGLTNTTTLQYLNLESNFVSEELIVRISALIPQNTSLMNLNFSNCNLPRSQIETVFHAISQISSIKHLQMSDNCMIANCTCVDLKDAIFKNNKVEYIDFSGCNLNEEGLYNILMPLTTFLHLKHLNLCSSFISNVSASELLPMVITRNKSLSHLNLTDCKLQETGLISVAKSLQTDGMLKSLSLCSNSISNAAACEIALAVRKNYLLEHLALSDCELEQTGLLEIAESLCTILSLKHLDLSHNVITDRAAATVALGVKNNTTMQYLDLRFCKLQDSGIAKICEVTNQVSMEVYI